MFEHRHLRSLRGRGALSQRGGELGYELSRSQATRRAASFKPRPVCVDRIHGSRAGPGGVQLRAPRPSPRVAGCWAPNAAFRSVNQQPIEARAPDLDDPGASRSRPPFWIWGLGRGRRGVWGIWGRRQHAACIIPFCIWSLGPAGRPCCWACVGSTVSRI